MKLKSVITVKQEEMSAISQIIGMINCLTDGEYIMIGEILKEESGCDIDDLKEYLIALREICEVEKECPKMS